MEREQSPSPRAQYLQLLEEGPLTTVPGSQVWQAADANVEVMDRCVLEDAALGVLSKYSALAPLIQELGVKRSRTSQSQHTQRH